MKILLGIILTLCGTIAVSAGLQIPDSPWGIALGLFVMAVIAALVFPVVTGDG